MGIEPKIISESEPIVSVTSITNPIGQKNVAGTQVNPATEDTIASQLNITLSALRDAICDTGASARTLDDIKTAIDNLEILSSEITKWGGATLTSRDISLDLKALTDVSITGILKSIGDIGAGSNLVTIAGAIETAVEIIDNFISGARGLVTEDNSAAINTILGAAADAIVAAGAVGTLSAKLRRATQGLEDLKTLIVLAAGTNAIGKLAANSGVDIGDVDVTSLVAAQLPAALSAGSNLKISHEEAAIAVPADIQARYYVKSIQDLTPGAAGTFWEPTSGSHDLSNFIHSSWYIYAPTTATMTVNCYLNISHDGGTTWRRASGYEILDANFDRDVWNSIDCPLMLCEAKLEVVIGVAAPATLDLMVIRKS